MLTSITHITMFVHDQQATLEFYQKLGFIVHTDVNHDAMRWLTLCFPGNKNLELAIIKAETEDEKALVGKQGGDKPFMSLESSDCKKDYETLKSQGVEVLGQPTSEPWGISMALKDNSGNMLYVCEQV